MKVQRFKVTCLCLWNTTQTITRTITEEELERLKNSTDFKITSITKL